MLASPSKSMRSVTGICLGFGILALLTGCIGSPSESPSASPAPPTATAAASAVAGIDPDTKFTPIFVAALDEPVPVKGTDGEIHLAYELLITNATPLPVQLDRLQTRDADSGTIILDEDAAELQQSVTRLGASTAGTTSTDPVLIGPAETWVAWMDVRLGPDAQIPAALEHRAVGALVRPEGPPAPFDAVVGTAPVSERSATTVAMPVKGGTWYMSEGCCSDDTHHRRGLAPINGTALVPQRFAIDFFMLDDQHRAWVGDPTQLSSYLTYRQPILAAAAGTVVSVKDGLPNTTSIPEPPPIPPIANTMGNHVIIRIDEGVYALYGHMDPGSVRVKAGDTVKKGQELGLIGSSGNSTTPHLHFHLQSEPTFFPTDSLPFQFDQFDLIGQVPDRIWDDDLGLQPTGTLPFQGITPSTRHDELPLDRTVVRVDGD